MTLNVLSLCTATVMLMICYNVHHALAISCYTCGTSAQCDPKEAEKITGCTWCRTVYPFFEEGVQRDCFTQVQVDVFKRSLSKLLGLEVLPPGKCLPTGPTGLPPFAQQTTYQCFCDTDKCNDQPPKTFKNVKCLQCNNILRACKPDDTTQITDIKGHKCMYCSHTKGNLAGSLERACLPYLPPVDGAEPGKCFAFQGHELCLCEGDLCNGSDKFVLAFTAALITVFVGVGANLNAY